MEEKYEIKGIEKIIGKIGKEKLAKYYEVDTNADFEKIITESFRTDNFNKVPSGLEVALCYLNPTLEDEIKAREEGRKLAAVEEKTSEICEKDEKRRALFGFPYMGNSILFFYVDEPIKMDLGDSNYSMGGVYYHGLYMGKGYFKEHKEELEEAYPNTKNIEAVDSYINKFIDEFKREDIEEDILPEDLEKQEIRKARNAEIILRLAGKESMDDMRLNDFILLKRKLEEEQIELKQKFIDKFTNKEKEERE